MRVAAVLVVWPPEEMVRADPVIWRRMKIKRNVQPVRPEWRWVWRVWHRGKRVGV